MASEAQRHSWKFVHLSADRNITAPSSLTEGLLSGSCSPLWEKKTHQSEAERKSQSGFSSLKFIMQIAELK